MNSEPMPKSTEADDVLAARADERLAHAYAQIASADAQLARLTEQLAKMEHEAMSRPSPLVERRPSRGRPALRGLVGLLVAGGIIGGALLSQSSYGEAAKPVIARWASPYLGSASWLSQEKPGTADQPGPSSVRLAAAETTPLQPTPPVQNAPQVVAATADPLPPELTQLLQTMARDLSTVQQGIEELKANQDRLASDNAGVAEQLKVAQEQLTRLVSRASEQDLRARTAVTPSRPVAEPARKPVPTQPSAQARAQPLRLQPGDR